MGDFWSAGRRDRYSRPCDRLRKLSRAASTSAGVVSSSHAERASTFAAIVIPLRPIELPEQATACQLWPGVPGTNVAVRNCAVGTTQLTSPTSVDPLLTPSS